MPDHDSGCLQHGRPCNEKGRLMLKGIKAGELVKKAGGAKGAELAKNGAKKAANHKRVDTAFQKGMDKTAETAIGAVFTFATGGAAAVIKRKRDKRKERRDAADLARQVGGTAREEQRNGIRR